MNALTSLISLLIFPAGLTLVLTGMFYEWVDRKLVARFQNRVGPRWFQPFADMVKLLAKEQVERLKPLVDELAPRLNAYLKSIGNTPEAD